MATGGYVPLSVKGIKGELSEVDSMPVALIGLPLIVQALENPESLDGMCKGNPAPSVVCNSSPLTRNRIGP